MHSLPLKNKRTKVKDSLEIVHTDLNGPQSLIGNRGEKYFVTFTDDYSKLVKVYPIKSRDQTFDCIVEYLNQVETLTGKRVTILRYDNGEREYDNARERKFADEKGITLDFSPLYPTIKRNS